MNTNQQYLYFDTITNEWQPAPLEQIVAMNDPDIGLCPLNPDGTPGPQTTFAAFMKKNAAQSAWGATKPAHRESGKQHHPHKTLPTLNQDTERIILYTCNYLRHILTVFTFLFFAGVGTTLADPRKPEIGLLIGLAVGLVAVIIIQLISKPAAKE